MGRKPTGEPVGRPEKPIDWEQFEQLCAMQCTTSEIASVLKVCEDTLYERVLLKYGEHFSVIYKRYSENGKASLRRNQYLLSKKNAAMAIWLGKHWLGQVDNFKEEVKGIFEDGIRSAIRSIDKRSRFQEASGSSVENESSLPHQGCSGQEGSVRDELGSTGALPQLAQLQHNPKS